MPGNKKKTKQTKNGKTKAMKGEEKGLPSFSAPKALCFPPARPKDAPIRCMCTASHSVAT